jgi:hypothetical protein
MRLHLGIPSALALAATACGTAAGEATDQPLVSDAEEVTSSANALTRAESSDVCGDTWCEGDYDFRFRRLTCREADATCHLRLEVLPRDGAAGRPAWRSCRTGGFNGFDSLVATDPSGYLSLQAEYGAAISECIMAIESSMR